MFYATALSLMYPMKIGHQRRVYIRKTKNLHFYSYGAKLKATHLMIVKHLL